MLVSFEPPSTHVISYLGRWYPPRVSVCLVHKRRMVVVPLCVSVGRFSSSLTTTENLCLLDRERRSL